MEILYTFSRTIFIFAKNHRHALAIKERFDLKFPEYGGSFAEVIDYSVNYYQSLIDDFSATSKMPQIQKVKDETFWQEASLQDLEEVREALRDLIKFIEREQQKIYYIDFKDEIIEQTENSSILDVNDLQSYRQKVEHYLKEHQDQIAIYKLRHNKELTKQDVETLEEILWHELGSKEQYEKDFGDTPITILVRNIVGLDRQAALEEFSEFLSEERLNIQQARFVELIVDYVLKNGTLDKQVLQQDPFRTLGNITSLFKDNMRDVRAIIGIIDQINANAEFTS